MTTSFNFGIDWRRKGLICWDARPGDALNLLPTPITYSMIGYRMPGAEYGELGRFLPGDVTRAYWVFVEERELSAGLVLGQDEALVVDDIPVQPSTTYSVGLWIGDFSGGLWGIPMIMRVKNQAGTTLFSTTFNMPYNGAFAPISATGTTDASTSHLYIEVLKDNFRALGEFMVINVMVVAGSVLPAGYNAGAAADLYDNVSARVTDAEWFLGMHRAYQDDADDSMLRLKLQNVDKLFSPEYGSSPLSGVLAPYRPVVVQSNDGAAIRTQWTGWIESIQPMPDMYGERSVDIQAAGPMLFLEDAQTTLAVQENKRADEIIAQLLNDVVIPPALTDAWLLGVAGYGEIQQTAYLADTVLPHTLDVGKTTFAYAGDNWVRASEPGQNTPDSFNAYRAIKDVVAAERGRFVFDRTGSAQFWNRHHLLMNTTVAAAFDNTMTDLSYEYAGVGEFKNDVTVTCHPRTVGADNNAVLWTLDQPITLKPGEARKINVSYKDDSENRIGGKEVHVEAMTFSQGSGSIALKAGANRAELTVINASSTEQAVLATAEVRGKKITSFGQMDAQSADLTSVAFYGRRTLTLNLPTVDRLDDAKTIADFELGRRKQPSGKVKTLKLSSDAKQGGGQQPQQLARTIGDLIRVQESQTAHDDTYFIMGENHRLTHHGELWETTWYLEPATDGNWWVLCQTDDDEALCYCDSTMSRLDQTTRIAY